MGLYNEGEKNDRHYHAIWNPNGRQEIRSEAIDELQQRIKSSEAFDNRRPLSGAIDYSPIDPVLMFAGAAFGAGSALGNTAANVARNSMDEVFGGATNIIRAGAKAGLSKELLKSGKRIGELCLR